ncbi:DNA polymerase III subunit psi [Candidatus Gillettellia adelgis]
MTEKRNWFLQQIGITQWTLRHPHLLQNEVAIILSPEVHLLIVAHVLPNPHDPLFCDVLRSLGLTPVQTYSLMPEQVKVLPKNIKCNSWWLGVDEPLLMDGIQLHSKALAQLSQNPQAKRALWDQIYHYEQYFYLKHNRSNRSLQY